MLKKLACLVAVCGALLLTGCVDYGQQTLTYRYDAKTDTLRIFQAYQGIFGEDQPEGLSEKEQAQLQSVLSEQRTFFFANWIWEYDRGEVRKELDNLNKPEAEPDAKSGIQQDAKPDAATLARRGAFFKLLLENVHVENGAFYLDGQGKLCAVQSVTVSQFSKLVAAGNRQIRDLLKLEATREKVSPEERALFFKGARQEKPFISVKGNQVSFRLPISPEAFEKSYGANSSSAKQLEEFKQQGGKVAFANNEMKWSLGSPSDPATTLTLSVAEKPYVANALEAVKSRAVIGEKIDIAAAAEAFVRGTAQAGKPQKR